RGRFRVFGGRYSRARHNRIGSRWQTNDAAGAARGALRRGRPAAPAATRAPPDPAVAGRAVAPATSTRSRAVRVVAASGPTRSTGVTRRPGTGAAEGPARAARGIGRAAGRW